MNTNNLGNSLKNNKSSAMLQINKITSQGSNIPNVKFNMCLEKEMNNYLDIANSKNIINPTPLTTGRSTNTAIIGLTLF